MSLPQGLTINRPSLTMFMSAVESAVSDECGSFSSARGSFATSHCDLLCALFVKTPEWLDSDSCQKCDQPFFWNFKQMWDSKKIGLRQVGDMCSIKLLFGRDLTV
jgi:hypothetical protein